jgi:hypothetical protein
LIHSLSSSSCSCSVLLLLLFSFEIASNSDIVIIDEDDAVADVINCGDGVVKLQHQFLLSVLEVVVIVDLDDESPDDMKLIGEDGGVLLQKCCLFVRFILLSSSSSKHTTLKLEEIAVPQFLEGIFLALLAVVTTSKADVEVVMVDDDDNDNDNDNDDGEYERNELGNVIVVKAIVILCDVFL